MTYTAAVITRAAAGHAPELAAVAAVTAELGRGIAGLVNALDPDLVTLGGLAPVLAAAAPAELAASYAAGLMSFRRDTPPPVVPGRARQAGPLAGAAEQVWARLLPPSPPD